MRNVLLSVLLISTLASAYQEIPGDLKRLPSTSGKLSYECEIHTRLKNVRLEVTIDTSSRTMEAQLDGGISVKGFASETSDSKTATTVYFLQGGSAPYVQQLTLSIRDGGSWAQFKKTYGGDAFVCSQN